MEEILQKEMGLPSLNDPVDTSSTHGRLTFNIFASLAEFEREEIRERTMVGLSAARAQGRVGDRPKRLSAEAERTSYAAAALYKEGAISAGDL